MDTDEVLACMSSLSIDWSCSPARIREQLMRNGCTGISEKRIKRLKSEHSSQKGSNEVKSHSSVKKLEEKYENVDKAAMKLQRLQEKGQLKGKNFEKALPNVASALRSGELKSEHAADVLTSRYLASKEPFQVIPGTDIKPHEIMFTHLANETFTLGHSRNFNNNKAYEFVCDLQSRFNILMESSCANLSHLGRFSSDCFSAVGANMFSALQQAYDETCTVWETRLDRHFKKGDGYFRCTCPLYRCEKTEFISWLTSKLSTHVTPDMVSEGDKMAEDLSKYHKGVAQAAHEVEKGEFCWQCRTQQSITTTKRCSQCRCAIYCSVECQKADWKKHKVVCTKLGDQRRAVDSAFPRQCTPLLNIARDTEKRNPDVEAMVKFWLAVRAEHHSGDRSLENFYKRLDRVIANEWWLEPKNSDAEEVPRRVDKRSLEQFMMLCFYMARDDDDSLSVVDFRTKWCPSAEVLMTRAAFLFTYKCFSMGESEASRNEMYSMMRRRFLKVAQSIQLKSKYIVEVD